MMLRLSTWLLQPCTRRFGFWSGVIISVVIDLLGDLLALAILYVWIKSHGGLVIAPW